MRGGLDGRDHYITKHPRAIVLSNCQAELPHRSLRVSGQVLCATLSTQGRRRDKGKKKRYQEDSWGLWDEERKKGGITKSIQSFPILDRGRSQSRVPFRMKAGSQGYTNRPTAGSQTTAETDTGCTLRGTQVLLSIAIKKQITHYEGTAVYFAHHLDQEVRWIKTK